MPAFSSILGALAIAGGIGYGAYSLGSSNNSSSPSVGPAPTPPAIPDAPTAEGAQNAAQAAIEKQKKMRALAGGKTLLTTQSPILSSTTGSKTLLGS